MKTFGWKPLFLTSIAMASAEIFLAGCPLITQDPKVTILSEGGQPVGRFLSLVPGDTLTLQAQSTSPDDTFSWASSAPDVAKVEGLGQVTAIAPGAAVITATGLASLGSDSVEVRVSPNTADEGEDEGEGEDQVQGEGEGEGQDYTPDEGELVRMTPLSGLFGYGLEGPYGFAGSLTKQEPTDPTWRLEGDFNFPTAGYLVEEPVVHILESYPEQVWVSIGIIPPPPGDPVAQVLTSVHVSVDIPASNEARFAIIVFTHHPPAPGEASWIQGESSPPVWSIGPPNPMPEDVIHFSGPTTLYQNGCRAMETLGQPQVHVDPASRQILLTFAPVNMFAPCGDERDPVCGIEGRFGPLERGDWVFSGHHPADPLVDFDIPFHVGPAGPGWDEHVKPIPDDPDGNFLTDAEEQALGGVSSDPNENGEMVPGGIRLARHLFASIAQLPICPQPPEPGANGIVQETTALSDVPLCKAILEADCIEPCSVCGEPYNCGGIILTRQGSTDPATASGVDVPFELRVSFAALHYMQHGSLSYKWREGGYEGRVDVVALASILTTPPPPPPPDPMEALIRFLMSADADHNGCLSFAEAQTAIPSIDQELFDLLASLCPNLLAGVSWPDTSSEICPYGGVYSPPEVLIPLLAKAVALADQNGDGMLSLDEVQALIPGLPPELFALLDQNGDDVLSAADIPELPPPPPPDPLSELLNLFYQADTDYNGCLSLAELQALVPSMDGNLFGLLKQMIDCSCIWPPMMDGTLPSGMPDGNEICICGNLSLTPDLIHAILAAVLAIADTDGDLALSFAETHAFVPPLTETIFGFLDRNGDGLLSALDIPEIPPPPPPDPLSALIGAILQADADRNGCLSLPELQTLVPATNENLFGLLKQAFNCPSIQPGTDGTDPNEMPEANEICFCGTMNLTPDLIHAIVAAVMAIADTNGDHALSFEEAQAFVPALPETIFRFLDRNGDGVLSAADIPEIPPPPPPAVHWISSEICPQDWRIEPFVPAAHDVIHFSGPTAVYSNACVALTTAGEPHIVINPETRIVELVFGPPSMMPCTDVWEPVCGLEGIFGPLPEGDWIFHGQHPADPLINFAISFHVGPGEPRLDEHVKPIDGDSDGDSLTDAEEDALQRDASNPDENGNGFPDGVELSHGLFALVERMPECGGDPATGIMPPEGGPCKTMFVVRCTEPCAICGEPYNCGHVEITNPEAQAAGEAPFPLTFAALHYMQHGSLSSRWNGAAYEERVDVLALLRSLGPPPIPEVVHLCEYLPLATGNTWEYKPWNSPLDVLYPIEVTNRMVIQDRELWALSNGALLGYANGFLNAFLPDNAGTTNPSGLPSPIPLFPEQVPIGVPIDTPILGKVVVHRGPLAVLLERLTGLTIQDFPLGDRPDAIAFAGPDATGVIDRVAVFARGLGLVFLDCPEQNTAAPIPQVADGLLLINASIHGNESCPEPPPMHWIPDGQCPSEWTVAPQSPAPNSIHFAGPTGTFGNECEAVAALGVPHLIIDGAQHTVELKFEPLPEPAACPEVFDPVCGLEGNFGPLPPGAWVFFAQSPRISFAVSFVVQEPGGTDPHLIPVPADLDGDYLSGDEEQQLERNPENPDENANGIPDGIDLARRIANRIEELPWFNSAGDPQDGLNPPELEQQFPTDRPYVIHFDYQLDCIWICPVCHAAVPAGHIQIVNPAIHASWRDGFGIPLSAWHFLQHTSFSHPGAACGASEEGRIDVVGLVRTLAAAPENRVEVQWIAGETGPNEWAVEILPLGMPLNGIRIAGPTQVFGNECEGRAALGGHPFIVMDTNAHSLTLAVDGQAPDVCAEVYAPVCGLEAQIIGIENGVWTFSAPMLDPPVHLTFTIGAK